MKRFVTILMAVFFCCVSLSVSVAQADTAHVPENLNAWCDYLVFSPEYSSSAGCWELWLLAYQKSGSTPDSEKDKCVSASRLSMSAPSADADRIAALMGNSYETEDMMADEGIRYYMFYEFSKPCYLVSPGGSLTTAAPINGLEFQEERNDCTVYLSSEGSSPGFMLLCQFWLYSGRYGQIPSVVIKKYGFDSEESQALYSTNPSDYCSNQEKLQRYCDSLIPVVSYTDSSSNDTSHSGTDIYYRKGGTTLHITPYTDGLAVLLTVFK